MTKRKVLILLEEHEEIAVEGLRKLEEYNLEYTILKDKQSIMNASQFEALLVRGTIIDRKLIENLPYLKIIARSGVGVDNIDVKIATEKNIYVCNVPDANFISVAEHVIGLIITLSHQIIRANSALSLGEFNVRHLYMGRELRSKTIGIIGYGRIGQLVAKKCIEGLEMNVLVYDPYINKSEVGNHINLVESVNDLLTNSDFISLHLPYTPSLHHFINSKAIKEMKKTAYLINCARGGLVDENALAYAIENGEIAGAGIDVFEQEPPSKNNRLLNLDEVIVTPHIAASTKESLALMAIGAAKEINRVLSGKKPKSNVNLNIQQNAL